MATQTQSYFSILHQQTYMSLKTFRKSGEGVPTPVWFAQDGEKLYVMTMADAGKVKRIRNNPQVEITPCDMRGGLLGEDYIPAQAHILLEGEQAKHANALLKKKYGLQMRAISLLYSIRRKQTVHLEITPAE